MSALVFILHHTHIIDCPNRRFFDLFSASTAALLKRIQYSSNRDLA
jgi:hypothetical protein